MEQLCILTTRTGDVFHCDISYTYIYIPEGKGARLLSCMMELKFVVYIVRIYIYVGCICSMYIYIYINVCMYIYI